jgi:nucleotide-binding universal stress UspA family protein
MPGRIVVGTDGSSQSAAALRWAANQASLTGSELELVTAWQYPVTYGFPVLPDVDMEQNARAAQDESVNLSGVSLPDGTQRTLGKGHPAAVLLEAAKGAELLVVGSRGHGGFAGMLLGSVSEQVVAHSGCPVVVVH